MLPNSTDRQGVAPAHVVPEVEAPEARALATELRSVGGNTELDGVIGGRLKFFAKEWSDAEEWTRSVLEKGLYIPLVRRPPWSLVAHSNADSPDCVQAVQKLIKIGAAREASTK